MECPLCKSTARIANGRFTSEAGSTDVYHESTIVCVNPACSMHETDMEKPKKVLQIVRNKVN